FFRIQVAEIIGANDSGKTQYVSWWSDAFRELKGAPRHACSHFVTGSPSVTLAEALRHAQDCIKAHLDAQKAKRADRRAPQATVVYTVWLHIGDTSTEHEFEEFSDASRFAKASEKREGITKVEIT